MMNARRCRLTCWQAIAVSGMLLISGSGCSDDSPPDLTSSEPDLVGTEKLPQITGPEQIDFGPELFAIRNSGADLILPPPDYSGDAQSLNKALAAIRDLIDWSRSESPEKADVAAEFVDRVIACGHQPSSLELLQTSTPRLHLVGHYEGNNEDSNRALVRVTDTSSPIVLCVCAHDAVEWRIEAAKGVRLEKVVVAGSHLQRLAAVPPGTEVVGWCEGPGDVSVESNLSGFTDLKFRFSAYCGISSYLYCDQCLKQLTPQRVRTRLGAYSATGSPVVVGPENKEWLLQMQGYALSGLYHQAVLFRAFHEQKELLDAEFWQLRKDSTGKSAIGRGTLFGPWYDSLQPLNEGVHQLAEDPEYGLLTLHDYGLATIEPDLGVVEKLPVQGLEKLNGDWPITADATRNLVFTWGYQLNCIDLKDQSVRILTDGNSGDIQSMVWCPQRKCLLGVAFSDRVRGAIGTVYHTNERGAAVQKINLDFPIPCTSRPQLKVIEDSLIVFTNERYIGRRCYVVDPDTGAVQFSVRNDSVRKRKQVL